MAGFLDKQIDIVDFCLTKKGRQLFSKNQLNFKYYSFFDDGVDYSPVISNSASYSNEELRYLKDKQIEETLVREATTGLDEHKFKNDRSCINSQVFSINSRQDIVPKIKIVGYDTGSIVINSIQDKIERQLTDGTNIVGRQDAGFLIRNSQNKEFLIKLSDDINNKSSNMFVLNIFESGSSGYTDVNTEDNIILVRKA